MNTISKDEQKSINIPNLPNTSRLLKYIDQFLRRLLDLGASLLGIIVLSPFFLAIAILIKRDSPGPVFYWGKRAGRGGRYFNILKFRTMYENPQSYQGLKVTAEGDPRITRVGAWLRDTKLNELPQLWNVLIGDMSLVGPRPEDPEIAAKWSQEVRDEILSVRPGITSPASVLYRNEESQLNTSTVMDQYLLEVLPSKLRLDQLYVRRRTLFTDIDIIFWTLMILLPRVNQFSIPEDRLYWGPVSRLINRYLTWFLADFLVAFLAVGTAGVIWRLSAPLDLGITLDLAIALVIALLFSSVNALLGLNRVTWSKARAADSMDLAITATIVSAIIFTINFLWPNGPLLPPGMVVVSGALAFTGFIATRYRSRLITGLATRWVQMRRESLSTVSEKILVIGAGESAQFSTWLIRQGKLAPTFSIIGMVDDDPRKQGTRIDGCNVIGKTRDIPELTHHYDVGLILYSISNISPVEQERILSICQYSGVPVVMVSDLLETLRAHFLPTNVSAEDRSKFIRKARTIDRLTGTYNQEQLLQLADMEIPRARRFRRPLSVVVLRLDYSRPEGILFQPGLHREVLHEAGSRCRKLVRLVDILGRCGEQELAVVLPETDTAGAQRVVERLRASLLENPVCSPSGDLQMVADFALVSLAPGMQSAADLIEAALQLLPIVEEPLLWH